MTNDTELSVLFANRGQALLDEVRLPSDLLSSVQAAHRRHRRYRLAGSALSVAVVVAGVGLGAAALASDPGRGGQTVGPAHSPTPLPGPRYHNKRFGFTVNIPAGFTSQQPPPVDGDGESWNSPDATAVLLIDAVNNNNALTPSTDLTKSEQHWDRQGGTVTFRSLHGDVVMVTGTNDGRVFYQRDVVRSNVMTTILWEYPIAKKSTYDPLVTSTVANFHPGPNRAA